MNHNDMFLTRVWDNQEKKMVYRGQQRQEFIYDGVNYEFESVTNDAVIASAYNSILGVCQMFYLELEDRFVPMLCLGAPDKNKKLIYQHDIVKAFDCKESQEVIIEVDYHGIEYEEYEWSGHYKDDYACLPRFKHFEILGNKFENPELKEQMTKYQDIDKRKHQLILE